MYRKRIPVIALVALIVIGFLFVGRARSSRQDEWWQGYMMGRLDAGDEESSVAPYMSRNFDPRGGSDRHFGSMPILGLGLLFLVGLPILFLFGLPLLIICGMFLRHHSWKTAGGPEGKPWPKHWPIPPWHRRWSEPDTKEDKETGEAEKPR